MEEKKQPKAVNAMTKEELMDEVTTLRESFKSLHNQAMQIAAQRNQALAALENRRLEMVFKVIENKDTFSPEVVTKAVEDVVAALGFGEEAPEQPQDPAEN